MEEKKKNLHADALRKAYESNRNKAKVNEYNNRNADALISMFGLSIIKKAYSNPFICFKYKDLAKYMQSNGYLTPTGLNNWTEQQVKRVIEFIIKYR